MHEGKVRFNGPSLEPCSPGERSWCVAIPAPDACRHLTAEDHPCAGLKGQAAISGRPISSNQVRVPDSCPIEFPPGGQEGLALFFGFLRNVSGNLFHDDTRIGLLRGD
jgi:hypothetical protein